MSVLIKNMHVPKSCSKCRFYVDDYGADFCAAVKRHTRDIPIIGKLPDCPLEDVPLLPNHGKLIDAAELIQQIEAHDYWVTPENSAITEKGMLTIDIKQTIAFTPTIIEAERNDYEIT